MPGSTHSETSFNIPLWVFLSAFAFGLLLLILLIAKRKAVAPGYFAPLLVTVICFLAGTVGASIILPNVTVVSKYSSGEADDGATTLEVGETTFR